MEEFQVTNDRDFEEYSIADDFSDLIKTHPKAVSANFERGKIYLNVTDDDINLAQDVPVDYGGYPVLGRSTQSNKRGIYDPEMGNRINQVIKDNYSKIWAPCIVGIYGGYKCIRGFYDYSSPCIVIDLKGEKSSTKVEIPEILYSAENDALFFHTDIRENVSLRRLTIASD